MQRLDVTADTLQEWYDKMMEARPASSVYYQQLRNIAKRGDSYTEFGVRQGFSLASILLTTPKKVRGYDIDLDWYNSHVSHLFDNYAKENKIDFKIYEADTSTCPVIDETDILHIDSLHTFEHCTAELVRHSHRVKKYIIFHDTFAKPDLLRAVEQFVKFSVDREEQIWEITTRDKTRVGHTIIKRK